MIKDLKEKKEKMRPWKKPNWNEIQKFNIEHRKNWSKFEVYTEHRSLRYDTRSNLNRFVKFSALVQNRGLNLWRPENREFGFKNFYSGVFEYWDLISGTYFSRWCHRDRLGDRHVSRRSKSDRNSVVFGLKISTRGFSSTEISFLALISLGDVTVTVSVTDISLGGLEKTKILHFWA